MNEMELYRHWDFVETANGLSTFSGVLAGFVFAAVLTGGPGGERKKDKPR